MATSMVEEEDSAGYVAALKLATGSALPMALRFAVELNLLELIGRGGASSASELAAQLPASNPNAAAMIGRILRLLAAHSVLNCTQPHGGGEWRYSLAPVCKHLTGDGDGMSVAPFSILVQDKVFIETWYHLKEAVLEGGSAFERRHGMNAFEYPATDPRFNKMFNQAMHEQSTIFMKRILDKYDGFDGVGTLVDVGGGKGASLKMILSKHPSIKAINFDLPHVLNDAQTIPGVEHVGGDMFVSVPKADAIFMKWICHDWSDSHVEKLLKNCFEALPENGKLIVAESTLPEDPKQGLGKSVAVQIDVFMMVFNPGGKERTEKEFHTLGVKAGFKKLVKDTVIEGGILFDRAHGMSMFEYPATDPKFNKMFNQAMYEQSTIFMNKILELYDRFEGVESLVDVGGGIGASLKIILCKYPSIKAINFDLPHVIQRAPSHHGVEHIDGDMFVSVPRGDAIFMKWVCHDWSDSHCLKLLKNCYEALPREGKVVIAERILPEIPNKEPLAFTIDLLMLAYGAGKERTESEFCALAKAAGFARFRKVCCAFTVSIMELHK